MLITNTDCLPSPIPELASQGIYIPTEGVFRVTELIGPPMIRRLMMNKHRDIVFDASDAVPALIGNGWHAYMKSYNLPGTLQETRLSMEVDGAKITGSPDLFTEASGWLNDFKTASTWAWVFGKNEWIAQLNIYAELLRLAGYKVSRLTDTLVFLGWSATEASRKPVEEYPPKRVMVVEQNLWTPEQTLEFIRIRLETHKNYVPCTEEERWGRGGSFAIVKPGASRATRVCETKEEAVSYCKDKGLMVQYITERPKTYMRCERYCPVRSVCPVALAMKHTTEET